MAQEIIFDWSRNFKTARKVTIDGLDRTPCDSLFQSETVIGKSEYNQQEKEE